MSGIVLSGNKFERITSYLNIAQAITGYLGQGIIIAFFLISGFTTVLNSYHFINTTIKMSENKKL